MCAFVYFSVCMNVLVLKCVLKRECECMYVLVLISRPPQFRRENYSISFKNQNVSISHKNFFDVLFICKHCRCKITYGIVM